MVDTIKNIDIRRSLVPSVPWQQESRGILKKVGSEKTFCYINIKITKTCIPIGSKFVANDTAFNHKKKENCLNKRRTVGKVKLC